MRVLHFILISVFFLGISAQECPPEELFDFGNPANNWTIPNQNNWQRMEVATWNIQDFPMSGNTFSYVHEIIADLQIDLLAIQELGDLSDFQALSESIPAYESLHTDYAAGGGYSGKDLGLLYRRELFTATESELLFTNDYWEFAGRFPFRVDLEYTCGNDELNFAVIVVHFKCCNDGYEQRLAASQILHDYLQNQVNSGVQTKFIVLGDFNDELDEVSENSFLPLLEDETLSRFVSAEIIDDSEQQSYPFYWGGGSFIDHLLITSGLFIFDNDAAEVQTLRIDDYTGENFYEDYISDHRPVMWSISLNQEDLPEGLVINEVMQNPVAVSDNDGEWFELFNAGQSTINLNGIELSDGSNNSHILQTNASLLPGNFFVLGRNADIATNGGISIDYEYENFDLNNSWDAIILLHPTAAVIDELHYDNGVTFPDPSGASMALDNPSADNSIGANWSVSASPLPSGDFGTPGAPNDSCQNNGDVNGDGLLDILDVVATVNALMEGDVPSAILCIADRNADGTLDVLDIVMSINEIMAT